MKTLTYADLIKALETPGCRIAALETLTDARLLKTGNTLGDVFKKSRVVAMVGAKYEDSVNRQHMREHAEQGFFRADTLPRLNDRWLVPNKVIINDETGTLYLRTQTTPGQRKVRPAKVAYVNADGRLLSRETVAPFLPKKHGNAKQEAYGVQGEIMVRDYKFSSIMRLRLNGETVALQHEATQPAIPTPRKASKRANVITKDNLGQHLVDTLARAVQSVHGGQP